MTMDFRQLVKFTTLSSFTGDSDEVDNDLPSDKVIQKVNHPIPIVYGEVRVNPTLVDYYFGSFVSVDYQANRKGIWSFTTPYLINDIVLDLNTLTTYRCLVNHTGVPVNFPIYWIIDTTFADTNYIGGWNSAQTFEKGDIVGKSVLDIFTNQYFLSFYTCLQRHTNQNISNAPSIYWVETPLIFNDFYGVLSYCKGDIESNTPIWVNKYNNNGIYDRAEFFNPTDKYTSSKAILTTKSEEVSLKSEGFAHSGGGGIVPHLTSHNLQLDIDFPNLEDYTYYNNSDLPKKSIILGISTSYGRGNSNFWKSDFSYGLFSVCHLGNSYGTVGASLGDEPPSTNWYALGWNVEDFVLSNTYHRGEVVLDNDGLYDCKVGTSQNVNTSNSTNWLGKYFLSYYTIPTLFTSNKKYEFTFEAPFYQSIIKGYNRLPDIGASTITYNTQNYSDKPIEHILDILTNTWKGIDKWGAKIPITKIHDQSFIDANTLITTFTSNINFNYDISVNGAIQELCKTCRALTFNSQGKYKIKLDLRKDKNNPDKVLTSDDILRDSFTIINPKVNEIPNKVFVTFTDKTDNKYTSNSVYFKNDTMISNEGLKISTMNIKACTSGSEADIHAEIIFNKFRYRDDNLGDRVELPPRLVKFQTTLKHIDLEEMDFIKVTNPKTGVNPVYYNIVGVVNGSSDIISFTAFEYADQHYKDSLGNWLV